MADNKFKVTTYWTRWSIPISNPDIIKYWWNTTCLRIESSCLPEWDALVIDTWSWYVPLTFKLLWEKIKNIHVLFSHYHHDHTQWLLLAPPTFIKTITTNLYWPSDSEWIWPREMLRSIMRPPFFPVHHKLHESHFTFHPIEFPQTQMILIHPIWWVKLVSVHEYEKWMKSDSFIAIWKWKYPKNEFLIITMYISNHPENTICYKIEEWPTSKTFVFLTDHENHDKNPLSLKNHLKWADLLIMDCQYTRLKYDTATAWYGHATPDYCVNTAKEVWAKKLWLTHHDPSSKDVDVEAILLEAMKSDPQDVQVFTCSDYMEIEV